MINQNIKEVLLSVSKYISNMINTIPVMVDAYRSDNKTEINKYILPFTEGMQWLNEALLSTKSYHDISMQQLESILEEFVDALENNDNVLVADLLEYEFSPNLEDWKNKIDKILDINV